MTLIGVLIALTCVVTMVIHIPIPGTRGYLNPGDVLVLLTGLSLGKKRGALVGGIGSAMADLFLGYAHYVPITLIVKGFEGFICGFVFEKTHEKSTIPAVAVGALCMAVGYFIPETFLYGTGAAAASFIPNLGQGIFGAIGGVILYHVLGNVFKKAIAE